MSDQFLKQFEEIFKINIFEKKFLELEAFLD